MVPSLADARSPSSMGRRSGDLSWDLLLSGREALWELFSGGKTAVPSRLKGVGHRSLCFSHADLAPLLPPHSKWRVP
jgi:hypothetical protein